LVLRLILLLFISWIMKLDKTLLILLNNEISGKDIILLLGGLFLLYKSSKEIFEKTEEKNSSDLSKYSSFNQVIVQILLLDIIFSIDSIITAVGLVDELWVMYTAVIVSMSLMLVIATPISEFVQKHPSIKILALCFLMMIGLALIAEGLSVHIPKGYIYFSSKIIKLLKTAQQPT
jgi:predicted tellurium resistance membrane protein TerC